MFGLGMPEILLILAIALIVIGPKKLPELAKTLGRAMGEFKRSAQDFKRSIDIETTVGDLDSPTDLKKVVKEVNENSASSDSEQEDPKAGTAEQPDPADAPAREEAETEKPASDADPQSPSSTS